MWDAMMSDPLYTKLFRFEQSMTCEYNYVALEIPRP